VDIFVDIYHYIKTLQLENVMMISR